MKIHASRRHTCKNVYIYSRPHPHKNSSFMISPRRRSRAPIYKFQCARARPPLLFLFSPSLSFSRSLYSGSSLAAARKVRAPGLRQWLRDASHMHVYTNVYICRQRGRGCTSDELSSLPLYTAATRSDRRVEKYKENTTRRRQRVIELSRSRAMDLNAGHSTWTRPRRRLWLRFMSVEAARASAEKYGL